MEGVKEEGEGKRRRDIGLGYEGVREGERGSDGGKEGYS